MTETTTRPTGPRIRIEQATIAAMLRIWCRDHHGPRDGLCEDCAALLDYAHRRLDTCPFGEEKPACNQCQVHCYSQTMRERVRAVMRYAGPRMLLRHPLLSIRHLIAERRPAPSLRQARQSRARRERP
jgi:hypothetical protein